MPDTSTLTVTCHDCDATKILYGDDVAKAKDYESRYTIGTIEDWKWFKGLGWLCHTCLANRDKGWIPAHDAPTESGTYWVKQRTRADTILGTWMRATDAMGWFYVYGHPMRNVTHYAKIEYPEPPEEQNA